MKNFIIIVLGLMSFPLIGQNSSVLTIKGEYKELQRIYDKDSISLLLEKKIIASFDRVGAFASNSGDEILGKGYCILYKDHIVHVILNQSINKGSIERKLKVGNTS